MEKLKQSLQSAGIACGDLDLLASTDKGDVLFISAPGGDAAIRLWKQLRENVPTTAHWPVLLGAENEIERHRENAEVNEGSVQETLPFSETIDASDWPANVGPSNTFQTPFAILSRKPHKKVAMGLVPTMAPWEVPAFLRMGGWNECPEAAVHCAVHKYWQNEYGATIAAATGDVVEMDVARPAGTREAALELAKQQYIYCADIVDQGTETLSQLAAGLLNGAAWYFWWD